MWRAIDSERQGWDGKKNRMGAPGGSFPLFQEHVAYWKQRNNAATVCRNTAFFPLSKGPVLITMSFICKKETNVIIIVCRIRSSHRHVPPSEKLHSESWRWVFICFRSSPWNWPCVSYCWQLDRKKKVFSLLFLCCSHFKQRCLPVWVLILCQEWGAETLKGPVQKLNEWLAGQQSHAFYGYRMRKAFH